jgi:SNF2 family DNA or RNA helicase
MEPFWNPAVENQAVDRIYRLGQTKPVQTIRFIMDKSIEANMLKIQKRKMDLAAWVRTARSRSFPPLTFRRSQHVGRPDAQQARACEGEAEGAGDVA